MAAFPRSLFVNQTLRKPSSPGYYESSSSYRKEPTRERLLLHPRVSIEHLLELLLRAQLVGMAALLLPAVDSAGVEARIAPGKKEKKRREGTQGQKQQSTQKRRHTRAEGWF